MGLEKCANCKYIEVNVNKPPCKGCNAENNSKNWVYNESLDEDERMIDESSLRLPIALDDDTEDIISQVWSSCGSIRKCKDLHDFGTYRYNLIKIVDVKIRKLKFLRGVENV